MSRAKPNGFSSLFCPYPNRAHSTEKRERVVANYLTGAVYRQFDRGAGKRLRRSILVGHLQHEACGANTVADQLERELSSS